MPSKQAAAGHAVVFSSSTSGFAPLQDKNLVGATHSEVLHVRRTLRLNGSPESRTSNDRLFFSVMRSYEYTETSGFPSAFLGAAVDHRSLAMTLDNVTVLKPDLVLDARYGIHRHADNGLPGSLGYDLKGLGLPASLVDQLDPKYTTMPTLTIEPNDTQYPVIGGNGGNTTQSVYQTTFQYLMGSVSCNRGNHNFHFGGEYRFDARTQQTFLAAGRGPRLPTLFRPTGHRAH